MKGCSNGFNFIKLSEIGILQIFYGIGAMFYLPDFSYGG